MGTSVSLILLPDLVTFSSYRVTLSSLNRRTFAMSYFIFFFFFLSCLVVVL